MSENERALLWLRCVEIAFTKSDEFRIVIYNGQALSEESYADVLFKHAVYMARLPEKERGE
jgi:hypothetical protein